HPERARGEHARPEWEQSQLLRVVAESLDGDPERTAVGGGRERERVRRPPESRCEEAPEEELTRPGAEPVQPASCEAQGDDTGAFLDDLDDAEAVAERGNRRTDEPVPDEEREGGHVLGPPVIGGD